MFQRPGCLRCASTEEERHSEAQMPEGKAGANFDGLPHRSDRLFELSREDTDDRERVMRVWIAFIKVDGLNRRLHSLLQLGNGIVCPTIRNDAGADPGEPDMRLREFGIELAGLAKQLACS